MWEYRATALEVLDGDTLRLLVDTGFFGRCQVDVRLHDVRAPELRDTGGIQTKEFVEGWIDALPRTKWPILVRTHTTTATEPSEVRSFTRYIGEIYDISSHESLNDLLKLYLAGHPEWGPGE